jgi:DNA mismatch repair protein MutL
MTGKFPSCVLNIIVPAESVDVNVHPAKTEVRFVNDKQIFNAIYYAVKNALAGDRSKPAFRMPPVTVRPTEEKPATPVQMELGRDLPPRAHPPAIRSSIHLSLLDIEVDEDTEVPHGPKTPRVRTAREKLPAFTRQTPIPPRLRRFCSATLPFLLR